jgi:pimeloyl-ACP methyl ester carboxylesterase
LLYAVIPEFAAQAANLKKNRKVEIFKAAGDALFVDQPERLNKSIESFARSLSR